MTKIEIKKALKEVATFVKSKLQEELAGQGHVLTGKLINSLKIIFEDSENYTSVAIEMEEYGLAVDSGVKARRIPYSRGSGAKSSKYIAGLIKFFKLKGLNLKNARSAAFATATVHKREGMPSQRSYSFSSNGRRTGFVNYTITSITPEMNSIMQQAIEQGIFQKFINTVQRGN